MWYHFNKYLSMKLKSVLCVTNVKIDIPTVFQKVSWKNWYVQMLPEKNRKYILINKQMI